MITFPPHRSRQQFMVSGKPPKALVHFGKLAESVHPVVRYFQVHRERLEAACGWLQIEVDDLCSDVFVNLAEEKTLTEAKIRDAVNGGLAKYRKEANRQRYQEKAESTLAYHDQGENAGFFANMPEVDAVKKVDAGKPAEDSILKPEEERLGRLAALAPPELLMRFLPEDKRPEVAKAWLSLKETSKKMVVLQVQGVGIRKASALLQTAQSTLRYAKKIAWQKLGVDFTSVAPQIAAERRRLEKGFDIDRLAAKPPKALIQGLTPRQREELEAKWQTLDVTARAALVLRMRKRTRRQIAQKLKIKLTAVRAALRRSYEKLDVMTRVREQKQQGQAWIAEFHHPPEALNTRFEAFNQLDPKIRQARWDKLTGLQRKIVMLWLETPKTRKIAQTLNRSQCFVEERLSKACETMGVMTPETLKLLQSKALQLEFPTPPAELDAVSQAFKKLDPKEKQRRWERLSGTARQLIHAWLEAGCNLAKAAQSTGMSGKNANREMTRSRQKLGIATTLGQTFEVSKNLLAQYPQMPDKLTDIMPTLAGLETAEITKRYETLTGLERQAIHALVANNGSPKQAALSLDTAVTPFNGVVKRANEKMGNITKLGQAKLNAKQLAKDNLEPPPALLCVFPQLEAETSEERLEAWQALSGRRRQLISAWVTHQLDDTKAAMAVGIENIRTFRSTLWAGIHQLGIRDLLPRRRKPA